ncbi:MAG: hypothetical protein JWO36_218 [Myxococcales bacterium]|nr:hypothetical protein [Myxococcales bacterium]
MVSSSNFEPDSPQETNRVFMFGRSWSDYETLLAMRGEEGSRPKLAYLDGVIELVSPGRPHEKLKSWIGRLLETYAAETGVELSAYGEWTQKSKPKGAGAEPDECYVFGPTPEDVDVPDLVIEIVWTSGGINKLEIYRRFGVREVWYWIKGAIHVYALRDLGYEDVSTSQFVPGVDLRLLCSFLDRPTMTAAIKDYRDALRAK